jgi:hypothetical protein
VLVNYVAQADARWSNRILLYICIPDPAEVRAGQLHMWLKLMSDSQTVSYCTFVFLTLLEYVLVNYVAQSDTRSSQTSTYCAFVFPTFLEYVLANNVAQSDTRWSNWYLLCICNPGSSGVFAGQLCGSS